MPQSLALPSHPLWCHNKQNAQWPLKSLGCTPLAYDVWHPDIKHRSTFIVATLKWSHPHPTHTHISYPYTYPTVCKADQTLFRINNHLELKSELNYKP